VFCSCYRTDVLQKLCACSALQSGRLTAVRPQKSAPPRPGPSLFAEGNSLLHAGRCWRSWRRWRRAARRRCRQTRPATPARAPLAQPPRACCLRPRTGSAAWRRPLQTCQRRHGAPRASARRARAARWMARSRCEQHQAARLGPRRQRPWLSAPGGHRTRALRQVRVLRRPRPARPSRRSSRRTRHGRLHCWSLPQPRGRAAGPPLRPPGALSLARRARPLTRPAARRGPRRASPRGRARARSPRRAPERPARSRARPASRLHPGARRARAGAGTRWRRL